MENTKTVSQIAKELGTNKSKIWRIIHSLNVQERFANGNTKLFADDDVIRIRAEFLRLEEGKTNVRPNDRTDGATDTTRSTDQEEALRIVKESYERQLAAKDEIILELRRQQEAAQNRYDKLFELYRREQENHAKQIEAQLLVTTADRPRLADRIKNVFTRKRTAEEPEETK